MAREMREEQATVYRAVVKLVHPEMAEGESFSSRWTKEITVVFGPYQDAKVAGGAEAYIQRVYGQYGYETVETRVEELSGEWREIGRLGT